MTVRRLSMSPRIVMWFVVAGCVLSAILVADSLLYWYYLSERGSPPNIARAVVTPVYRAFFYVTMAPVAIYMARRVPLGSARPVRAIATHLLFAVAVGLVVGRLYEWLLLGYRLWCLHVHPPIIHVPQWMLFYGVILGATTAFDSQSRSLARERQAVELRVQLAETQLRALRHQLHPHFVFNTLQAVSTLIHRDTLAADALLGQLSALLRRLLDHLDRGEVSLAEEFAFIESYLAIERARLGDRLSVSIDLPPALVGCQVPPLLIQPLVENAVKHAVVQRRAGGHIGLAARRAGEQLDIEVCDDGPGLPASFGPQQFGVGLRAMSSRLTALYGDAKCLCLESVPGGGLLARITLPLRVTG
jgi:two-component system, LytTR family, sensor kinase